MKMDLGKSKRKKTSIIVSLSNRKKLLSLGNFGETYDDIINRLVDYDIKLRGKEFIK